MCQKASTLLYRECRGEHCSPANLAQQRLFGKGSHKANRHGRALLVPTMHFFDTLGPLCEGAVSEADWGRETCRYFSTCFYRGGCSHPPTFAACLCLYMLIYKGRPVPTKEAIQIKTRQDPTGCAWLFFYSNIQGEQKRHRKFSKKIKKTC